MIARRLGEGLRVPSQPPAGTTSAGEAGARSETLETRRHSARRHLPGHPPRGWYWPAAIVGLLLGGAAANVGLMLIAVRDASFSVEPDYYRKAVDWDRTMAQEERNAALGWSVAARFADGGARLAVRVVDRSGAPLGSARVQVEAFPSARASQVQRVILEAGADGTYTGSIDGGVAGLWEIRVTATRGEEVFTAVAAAEREGQRRAAGRP